MLVTPALLWLSLSPPPLHLPQPTTIIEPFVRAIVSKAKLYPPNLLMVVTAAVAVVGMAAVSTTILVTGIIIKTNPMIILSCTTAVEKETDKMMVPM